MNKSFGQNILLLVPHPDDEVVACFATIRRAQAQGAKINALHVTHGCIARELRWPWDRRKHDQHVARRKVEALHANNLLKLNYIGCLDHSARSLWQKMPQVYLEISHLVKRNKFDQLWAPAYEGGNSDHDVLNAIASLFTTQMSVLEFAEYNFAQGRAHSQEFPSTNGSEEIITLTSAEQEQKRQALKIYESEQCNLGYVKTERECFRPIAKYDYSQPPHGGTLWHARFHWVPFRHPRVDFTPPAQIRKAITSFLASSDGA